MVFSFGLCFANSTTLMNKHQFDVPWWRFEYKWTRLSQILWSFPCDFLLLLDSWLRDRSTPPFPIVQHTFIRSHYWFYHTWLILLSFHSPLPSFLDLCSKTLLAWHVWKKKTYERQSKIYVSNWRQIGFDDLRTKHEHLWADGRLFVTWQQNTWLL